MSARAIREEIARLTPKAETGEQWADICALEVLADNAQRGGSDAADALQAFEERAVRCRSNGRKCICDPACFDVCYVEAEVNEIDECALAKDRAARDDS